MLGQKNYKIPAKYCQPIIYKAKFKNVNLQNSREVFKTRQLAEK